MKNIILYLWQLPQNILGLFVILFSKAKRDKYVKDVYLTYCRFGVSLGAYIILYHYCKSVDIKHEQGHQKQSLYLGPLYLFIIGIPSALGNLIHRIVKFNYYNQPWEKWADKLGGVTRGDS